MTFIRGGSILVLGLLALILVSVIVGAITGRSGPQPAAAPPSDIAVAADAAAATVEASAAAPADASPAAAADEKAPKVALEHVGD